MGCRKNLRLHHGTQREKTMNALQKEEYRYNFAGMAMQAMINAMWSNREIGNFAIETAKRHGYKNFHDFVAAEAIDYANALINELEQEE